MRSDVTIKVSDDVSLQEALKKAGVDNLASVIKLTVTGNFNRYHFSDIFRYNSSVTELDLSTAIFKKNDELLPRDGSDTLKHISFPLSVRKLLPNLFCFFRNLTSIAVPDDHEFYSVEDGILFSKDKTVLLKYPSGLKNNYIVPDTVVEIGSYAFFYCKGLTSFVIPEIITKINDSVFCGCSGLTTINIPETIIEIGDSAFAKCTGLTEITIPKSVEYIGNSAFSECEGLKSVKILNPAIKLGERAFSYCSELTTLEMHKSVLHKKNEVFYDCEKLPLYIKLKTEKKNKQIKQNKIWEIKTTSAHDWLETLMKNSKYTYKINKSYETKLQLYVKIDEKTKLSIPVPYTKFQTILPKLMEAIKRYEEAVNEFDFVLVERTNTKYDEEGWINQ